MATSTRKTRVHQHFCEGSYVRYQYANEKPNPKRVKDCVVLKCGTLRDPWTILHVQGGIDNFNKNNLKYPDYQPGEIVQYCHTGPDVPYKDRYWSDYMISSLMPENCWKIYLSF